MWGPHNRIIAAAGKQVLEPLGFRRQGRSRVWLADRDWWLIVVEFQPSAWSRGSYLNVAAHWLWSDGGYLSFDHGGRMAGFADYVSRAQYAAVIRALAETAAREVQALADAFTSIEATADLLAAREASPTHVQGSWSTYHAGVAAGLAGRTDEADALFRWVTDDRVKPAAERLSGLLSELPGFRREVASLIARQRDALGLPELIAAPF